MLAITYNAGSMLQSDYGLLEQVGSLDSPVFRGRGNDGGQVALRFWRGEDERLRATLLDMAYAASQIRHPMLSAVGGCQSFGGSILAVVSEFVPGVTLDRWLFDVGQPGLRIALDFVRRLCLGVHAIHQRGLTHSALHPANLMVLHPETQPGGRIVAKLLDVGVPALLHGWPPQPQAAAYLAPELLGGVLDPDSPGSAINPRMNVYSCGCLLHYMCTGRAPFSGETLPQLMAASAAGLTERPSELNAAIPADLEDLMARTLAVDPEQRPASAAELAAAIGTIEARCKDSGVRPRVRQSTPPSQPEPARDSAPPARASFPELAALSSSGLRTSLERVHPRAEAMLRSGSYAGVKVPKARSGLWLGVLAGCLAGFGFWLVHGSGSSARQPVTRLETPHTVVSPVRTAAPPPPATPPEMPIVHIQPRRRAPEHSSTAASPEPAPDAPQNPALASLSPPTAASEPAPPKEPEAKSEPTPPEPQASREQPTAKREAQQAQASAERKPHAVPAPPAQPTAASKPELKPVATPAPVQPAAPPPPVATKPAPAPQPSAAGTPRPSEVQVSAVDVRGSLTSSSVRRAIERVRPQLTQCYQRYSTPGRNIRPLQISAVVDEVGRLRNTNLTGGNYAELNACLLKATSKMVVADAPDTGTVRATWTLSY